MIEDEAELTREIRNKRYEFADLKIGDLEDGRVAVDALVLVELLDDLIQHQRYSQGT
jgi:hypothetical protein